MDRLANAMVSLEACRATLGNLGQRTAARELRGLEFADTTDARFVLGLIKGVQVFGSVAASAKQDVILALESALNRPEYDAN